jgi:hypothetical protein
MNRPLMEGLVSVIIPVYNRAKLLAEAVTSALGQDYRRVEIIIVDDGSVDETVQVARDLASAHPAQIRVLRQENKGPGAARERGRQAARGEFIQYLDSDDLLLPGKLAMQVAGLRANPDRGVAYGFTRYRHANGQAEPRPWKGSGGRVEVMFPSFLKSRWWDTPTPLYRADVCDAAGPWTDLRLEEDWEYDCRVASLGTRLWFCESYVAEVRDHEDGRLCRGAALDPRRLSHRARAHQLILDHAKRAGIPAESEEMTHFARALFLLARQCGAASLPEESRRMFDLARTAAGPLRARGMNFALYRAATGLLGWSLAGRLACAADRFRK